MHCPSCGHENRETAKFCEECAAPLPRGCTRCGTELRAGAKFCDECAHPVGDPAPQAEPAAPAEASRSPRDYTPKHLAEKILHSKAAMEGERKQVTVMFADVRGSMELASQLDPEEWHRILDRFFEILAEGVHRFEGTVNQYTGDGIMALFGAPISHEDHAQRACYAALHLREQLARYATEVKREHGLGFSTRIGLHSGEVVVGKIGDDLRMDYTAQGHSVGLAQRMEALASPDSCYLTADTGALVAGYFELEDLGEFNVRGVAGPVRVHRLVGIGASRTRFDISRARGLSRFVGRAADLRVLEEATGQCGSGNGQVVGVVAEAGTGKSRLCFEFLERCRARGMQVFEGRAVAHGRNIPYLPVLEVFRAFFGITSEDTDRSAREKIAGRMVLLEHAFADALPLLFDFLGVGDPQNPAPKLDPEARQRQLLAVMRRVIQSVSEEQPTVTLIEDLHWIDDASEEFLAHMVGAREGSRNLLLLNFRPEYHADWMQKSWYRQIPLTPLGRDAIAELLDDLLGTHPSLAALPDKVHERTGGNPFFTEEVAQTLIESGHLVGTRGAYELVTPLERLEVPGTVQAILSARIDRLAEREKRVLQIASVIGKDFAEPLLTEVADLPAEELGSALAALRDAEFLHQQAIYPVVEYSFKHPLTQEVALGSQLRKRRCAVHARVARAIERQDAEHLDERSPLLAHHHEEAGESLLAARWHRVAAEWVGATDYNASVHHWSRVRSLLREIPDDREAAELGIAACKQLLNIAWRLGTGLEEATQIRDQGQALAHAIDDRTSHLMLASLFARVVLSRGDVAGYVELALQNEWHAREMGDAGLEAMTSMWVVDAFVVASRFQEVVERADAWLARFPRRNALDEEVGFAAHHIVVFWRGYALCWLGRLQEGLEGLELGRRLLLADQNLEIACYSGMMIGEASYRAGDGDRALTAARQGEEISHKLGDFVNIVAAVRRSFTLAHLTAGRAEDAVAAGRAALELYARVERQWEGTVAVLLAEALLMQGALRAAHDTASNAIALCRSALRLPYEAEAHGVIARAALRRDGVAARDRAEAELAEAAALIERCGAITLGASLLEWRAELAEVLGDEAGAERLLREAERAHQAIGATGRAERLAERLGS